MNFAARPALCERNLFCTVLVVARKVLQQISYGKNIYFCQSFCKLWSDSRN